MPERIPYYEFGGGLGDVIAQCYRGGYYNSLAAGTYDFYFRSRATVPGGFTQPPALSEMMYDSAVRGHSAGARVEVAPKKAE